MRRAFIRTTAAAAFWSRDRLPPPQPGRPPHPLTPHPLILVQFQFTPALRQHRQPISSEQNRGEGRFDARAFLLLDLFEVCVFQQRYNQFSSDEISPLADQDDL